MAIIRWITRRWYFNCCRDIKIGTFFVGGNDIQSKVMAFAFGLSAEIERNLISQRTKASLDNIRATGKKLGRPFAAQSKKLKLSRNTKKVRIWLDAGLTKYRIAKMMDVSPATVSNFINRMGWWKNTVLWLKISHVRELNLSLWKSNLDMLKSSCHTVY